MIFVIDVGNTNITYGVYEGKELKATFRMMSKTPRTSDEYGMMLINLFQAKGIDIEDEEKYNEIKNDIRLECELYGKVMEVFMPRKDIDDNKVGGMGNAYVEFATVEDCITCRKVS